MKMTKTIPAIPVINIGSAVNFYRDKLGFTCPYHDGGFARLNRDEVEIHLWTANDLSWKEGSRDLAACPISRGAESFLAGTSGCRIEVQGIDELFAEYKAKGVLYSSETVIQETPWRTREFPALDLHRNLITFFQRI